MSDSLLVRISWSAILLSGHQVQVQELVPEADFRGQSQTKLPIGHSFNELVNYLASAIFPIRTSWMSLETLATILC